MPDDLERARKAAESQMDTIRMYFDYAYLLEEDEPIPEGHDLAYLEDPESVYDEMLETIYGTSQTDEEFTVLLCGGGPAVRIRSRADRDGNPVDATLQFQDWFAPWTDVETSTADDRLLDRLMDMMVWDIEPSPEGYSGMEP